MPRKISEETRRLIGELYAQDLHVAEIAIRTDASYSTVYGYTKLKQRTNPETKQLFKSLTEYEDYQVRQRQSRQINRELSGLIGTGLNKLVRLKNG